MRAASLWASAINDWALRNAPKVASARRAFGTAPAITTATAWTPRT
jgi:hypothetical protein